MSRSVYSFPFACSFLDEIVTFWCDGQEAIEKGLILVPSRRAARHLTEAFLRKFDTQSTLLPRIVSLGELEEEAPLGANYLVEVPPSIDPLDRQSFFANLILEKERAKKARSDKQDYGYRVDIAWQQAGFLAELQDEADRAGANLAESLPKVLEEFQGDLAKHSKENLDFLDIITRSWPLFLKEKGLLNPTERHVVFLKETAALLSKYPYPHRIWAVGFNDVSSGVGCFLKSILEQNKGALILQGLDKSLSQIKTAEGSLLSSLPASHPQYMLVELLQYLEVDIQEIKDMPVACSVSEEERTDFWRRAMLPVHYFSRYAGISSNYMPGNTFEIEANESQHEARCIALSLCGAIADSKKTAALVTSDRKLIKRVTAELKRFGVHTDSGPGTLLSDTPPALFIRLILKVFEDGCQVEDCLAVLKHPLCGLGLARVKCRELARKLEKKIRLERSYFSDIQAIERYFQTQDEDLELKGFVLEFCTAFKPLLEMKEKAVSMDEVLTSSLIVAEQLANFINRDDDPEEGAHALWCGDDGNKLASHMAALIESLPQLGSKYFLGIEKFFTQSLKTISIIGLQGYSDGQQLAHPRIFILGLYEARLLSFDLTIIGGLVEGSLPPIADPSPWLSRSLYADVGLYPTQRTLGSAAYNFVSKTSGTGDIILSHSKRQGTSPLIESSWLVRAKALLSLPIPRSASIGWEYAIIDAVKETPHNRPFITVKNSAKPHKINLTSIDNLIKAPFAFYTDQVLKLRKLDRLDQKGNSQDFGIIVHDGLEEFYNKYPGHFPSNGQEELTSFFVKSLSKSLLPEVTQKWILGRLENIAAWVAEQERNKPDGRSVFHETELYWNLPLDGGEKIIIKGRADRLDFTNGDVAIIDYKTGAVPTKKDVREGFKNQLPIEAAALLNSDELNIKLGHTPASEQALKDIKGLSPEKISMMYWGLKGVAKKDKEDILKPDEKTGITDDDLIRMRTYLIGHFNKYLKPDFIFEIDKGHDLYEDYRHLARYDEWRGSPGGEQS